MRGGRIERGIAGERETVNRRSPEGLDGRPADGRDAAGVATRGKARDEDVARLSVAVRERQDEPPGSSRRNLRTFQFPGGRIWTVGVLTTGSVEGIREVLRFVSGSHRVDVERWPDDWAQFSDAQLADLLRLGAPPRVVTTNATPHRRRHDDLQR